MLSGLDPDQLAAVTAPPGVVVVRAGAGSGKTRVLTRRIAWRAQQGSADAERTLAITFTKQAATEMRTRLVRFELDGRPTIGTFHAVGLRLLSQRADDTRRAKPLVVTNRGAIVSSVLDGGTKGASVPAVLNAIDWAHAHMATPQTVASMLVNVRGVLPQGMTTDMFARVLADYEALKKRRGVVDLNDFLTTTISEARRDARFLESIRFQFRHICVDEAQDMNLLQYEFMRLIAGDTPDLFLVGDPNQAIFGFNGADRTLFDTLPRLNGTATVLSLPSNYRCTPQIVATAVGALERGHQQADAVSLRPEGLEVSLHACDDEASELMTIERELRRMQARCGTWNQLAVLARVNAVCDDIVQHLEACNIPVRSTRLGPDWSRAMATATSLTGRESLSVWSSDILDNGEYSENDAEFAVAALVRTFLDNNRSGSVDGRTFGNWAATNNDANNAGVGVEVLSFHAAKGREWFGVVVAGAEVGLLPHRGATSAEQRGEEARLAYVAFTRAADDLAITWTRTRNGRKSGPSPLLPSVNPQARTASAPPREAFAKYRRNSATSPRVTALKDWRYRRARLGRVADESVLTDIQVKRLADLVDPTPESVEAIIGTMMSKRFGNDVLQLLRTTSDV